MSSSGTVGADERLRLFLGFRLPDAAARAVAAWQEERLAVERVRLVPVENLHVTIAFLGSRPAGEIEAVAGALREAVDGVTRPVLTPTRYRETRSVGMRPASPMSRTLGSRGSASTSRRRGNGFRTSPSPAFANALGSSPRSRIWGR